MFGVLGWRQIRDQFGGVVETERVRSRLNVVLEGGSVNCRTCRGACCESFSLPLCDIDPPSNDAMYWIKLHGREHMTPSGTAVSFECRCTALAADGRCLIYDNRPYVCQVYQPGSHDCLETVRVRRTPGQYKEIREGGDPARIHKMVTTVAEK